MSPNTLEKVYDSDANLKGFLGLIFSSFMHL